MSKSQAKPYNPEVEVAMGRKIEHHLIALWLLLIALIGFRIFEFYEGGNDTNKVNASLWKLKKGQNKVLDYLKHYDSYDDY